MKSHNASILVRQSALTAAVLVAVIVSGFAATTIVAQTDRHSSVTGYYGLDDDGLPMVDRRGIMLVFDGAIAPETVSVDTFRVSLNDGSFADVVETRVAGRYVFLRLRNELASDATPIVGIAEGEEIEDLAGNSTNRRKLGFVRIKDGIAPRLTVTLSGGSGLGTGDEGPDRLTNKLINIHVTSDESLQGAPRIIVVCSELNWIENDGSRQINRDIDDFISNRNGPHAQRPSEPIGTIYTCGYDANSDGKDDPFELTENAAHSRSGKNWEFTWKNLPGATRALRDGQLAVVAYARDRSRYERFGKTVSNWATAISSFGLDTKFDTTSNAPGVRVHPPNGSVVREERPFVLLEFPTETTVTLGSVKFDGMEIVDEFEIVMTNEFVYWPLSMNQGKHKVEVDAVDAAGNEISFDFEFVTTQRGDFVLPLFAGWNAVSVPADPVDPNIEDVFTNPAIEAVISWYPYEPEGLWAFSTRDGDSWKPWRAGRGVDKIRVGSGYWVKSSRFIEQPIALTQHSSAVERMEYDPCPSSGDWFFVGVTDEDGDQTQNHFGEPLKRGDVAITAQEYLDKYFFLAFSWNPIEAKYRKLTEDDVVVIGEGIWYRDGGSASCP